MSGFVAIICVRFCCHVDFDNAFKILLRQYLSIFGHMGIAEAFMN